MATSVACGSRHAPSALLERGSPFDKLRMTLLAFAKRTPLTMTLEDASLTVTLGQTPAELRGCVLRSARRGRLDARDFAKAHLFRIVRIDFAQNAIAVTEPAAQHFLG